MEFLAKTIDGSQAEASPDARLLWLPELAIIRNEHEETTIVLLQQQAWSQDAGAAIPIEGSGVRVVCQRDRERPIAVTGATSTLREDVTLASSTKQVPIELFRLDQSGAISILANALGVEAASLQNAAITLVAFDPFNPASRTAAQGQDPDDHALTVGYKVEYNNADRRGEPAAVRVFYDLARRRLSSRRLLASGCSGLQFSLDPVTKTGSQTRRPNSPSERLDPLRDRCTLHDLAALGTGEHCLSGPRVSIKDPNPLGLDPPRCTSAFDFSSRTNEFAAVSAYAHCDALLRMLEAFGLPPSQYVPGLPVTVVHRAPLLFTAAYHDGKAVAAYVMGLRDQPADPLAVEMRFALGDLADCDRHPLGAAADVRWVLHEFCHVLLAAATGELEFRFAHSAGDALAAIMCDPDLRLASDSSPGGWRGLTFPFVSSPLRRHDRDVHRGWGWTGSLYDAPPHYASIRDPAGYRAEQILSTTLFRLYRALGGDALDPYGKPDRPRRRAAAQFTFYLIVRAIKGLGPAAVVPAVDVTGFVASLIDADIGTQVFGSGPARRLGGSVHKVIRWAFQQQGLYHAADARDRNRPGDPEPIDIYIERSGTQPGDYGYTRDWHSKASAMWVRRAPDNGPADEAPRIGMANYIYVEVGNLGTSDAGNVTVEVLTRAGQDHDTWDAAQGAWHPLLPANGAVTRAPVARNTATRFGPFAWAPMAGKHGVFVRATTAGDRSNADINSRLACAAGPTPMRDLVPFDNNLGYRAWRLR